MTDLDRISTYLRQAVTAIDWIGEHTRGINQEQFESSRLVQDAVIRNFEIVGEAAARVLRFSPEFDDIHPGLSLRAASGFRNVLAHDYDKVDFGLVWQIFKTDLPAMRENLLLVLATLEP